MFPRVGGAILALAAAALLALATLTPAWWSGHPDVDGHAMRLKSLEVGPLGATSCNTGGDGKCTNTSLTTAFQTIGRVEAGVNSLVALMLIVLTISTLRRAEGRRLVGKAVIATVAVAGLGGILLIIFGPGIKAAGHSLSVPVGYGLALFWGGVATAIAAALVTAKEIPRALYIAQNAPRVTPLANPQNAALPPAQPFDVQALFAEDKRPSDRELQRPAHSPGGALAGPSGPLGTPQPPPPQVPLFASAPQLRPLYEMNDGVAPSSIRPKLPERAPTPLAREQIERITDGAAMHAPARPAIPLPALPRPKPPSLAPPRPAMPPPFDVLAPREIPKPPSLRPPTMPPPKSLVLPKVERAETDPNDLLETRQHERADTSTKDDIVPATEDHTSPGTSLGADLPADATGVNPVVPQHDVDPTSETEPVAPPPTQTIAVAVVPAPTPTMRKSGPLPTPTAPTPAAPPPITSSDTPPPVAVEPAPKIPISTASTSLPPPTVKQAQSSGPSPACPQCESPMVWVEEHLRFYCKSCRMYF